MGAMKHDASLFEAEIDRRLKASSQASPRKSNAIAPGRKKTKKQ